MSCTTGVARAGGVDLEEDSIELAPAEHTRGPHGITDMHTGRGFAGERPCLHADHDQSTAVHTPTPSVLAMKPLQSWTSESIEFDWDGVQGRLGAPSARRRCKDAAQVSQQEAMRGRMLGMGSWSEGVAGEEAPRCMAGDRKFWGHAERGDDVTGGTKKELRN